MHAHSRQFTRTSSAGRPRRAQTDPHHASPAPPIYLGDGASLSGGGDLPGLISGWRGIRIASLSLSLSPFVRASGIDVCRGSVLVARVQDTQVRLRKERCGDTRLSGLVFASCQRWGISWSTRYSFRRCNADEAWIFLLIFCLVCRTIFATTDPPLITKCTFSVSAVVPCVRPGFST